MWTDQEVFTDLFLYYRYGKYFHKRRMRWYRNNRLKFADYVNSLENRGITAIDVAVYCYDTRLLKRILKVMRNRCLEYLLISTIKTVRYHNHNVDTIDCIKLLLNSGTQITNKILKESLMCSTPTIAKMLLNIIMYR